MARLIGLSFVFMAMLSCSQEDKNMTPWADLSWLEKVETKVIIACRAKKCNLEFSYFNKSTRELLDKSIVMQAGQADTVRINIFRPEIVNINTEGEGFAIYLIPDRDLEILINDEVKIEGENQDLYQLLYDIGDHKMEDQEFTQFMQEKEQELPQWLKDYLPKSRELKKHYKDYQMTAYSLYS